MATYAIGDVQGCFDPLRRLADRVGFDPARDRLWLVGDLVNRGNDSLGVLRFVRDLGTAAVAVLGNHDLHLIAIAKGVRGRGRRDTLEDVLEAPDREELIEWLRQRPLLHREGDRVMVHAGLAPQWSIAEAERIAREGEEMLRGVLMPDLLRRFYRQPPRHYDPRLPALDRAASALVQFTLVRTVMRNGEACLEFNGPPSDAPPGCTPWFHASGRASTDATVIFGHWAALGFHREPGVIALDSGCVWGKELTAVRLEDGVTFRVAARA